MKSLMVALCLCLIPQVTLAHSPYAGMQTRTIKALSDQQIADLKAGRGMGLAMAAELNGYPGPVHVLELSDQLGLSAEQKTRVGELFATMKAEAVSLGAKLLALEENLDQQFANHSITSESLKTTIARIGVTQAELRNTHLKYHLQTAQILSTEQMQRYSVLEAIVLNRRSTIITCSEWHGKIVCAVTVVISHTLTRSGRATGLSFSEVGDQSKPSTTCQTLT